MTSPSIRAFTVGVEEEYQLVDAESSELRSAARAVLESDWTGEIKPEMHQHTLEVGTRVCRDSAEVRAELARLRMQTAVAAEARGCRLVSAGLHPFSHWRGQLYTDAPVYDRIRREYRRLADSQTIYGLHIHIGLPEGVDAVAVMNVARLYLPHLLGLTASSPVYLGEDTGYASYRSVLWSRWPRSGPPPVLEDAEEYRRLVDALIETGRIDGPGRIYWTMRPHHLYPTLEFRVADATPRLEDAVFCAALARTLVAAIVRGVVTAPAASVAIADVMLHESVWLASRDGLAAQTIEWRDGRPRPVALADSIEALVGRLAGVAAELGETEALAAFPRLRERGDAASRMRARPASSDPAALVRWLADETLLNVGMDRRAEQRPGG